MDCSDPASYSELSLALHRRASRQCAPINGAIELTWRCNLSCRHCYVSAGPSPDDAAPELSRDEYTHLFAEIAEAGCLWLLLTGGEPLLRSDFAEIYLNAKRRGLLITLFTNATAVTPRVADVLAEWPPLRVEVTVYGANSSAYETVTGVPGSYRRCLDGLDALHRRGVPLALKALALTSSVDELDGIRRLADSLGAPFRYDGMLNPRADGCPDPLALRLGAREIVALDVRDPQRMAALREFAAAHVGPPAADDRPPSLYACSAGKTAFAVDPYGVLRLCLLAHDGGFDLRGGGFREGWQSLVAAVQTSRARRTTKCTSCHLRSLCGMCPEVARLETGDCESPVEFLCEVAHLRALALGLRIPEHGECAYCPSGALHRGLRSTVDALIAGTRRDS